MTDDTTQDGDKEDTVRDRNKAARRPQDTLHLFHMSTALSQRLRVQSWGLLGDSWWIRISHQR